MPPELLDRVLEPFYTTKPVGKGTGLGLSMVHGFVTQSGGAMRLESRVGQGTRVSLWLPQAPMATVAAAPPAEPAPARADSGCRVLLVDDDALARLATAAALRELGHDVVEARDGAEALIVIEQRPDLQAVVTDYAMPRMTGAELAQAIGARRPGLVVLMITGYAAGLPGTRPEAVRVLLRKPFRMEELDARLRDATGIEMVPG